jgi:beta-barrel assembly-enhancing protease
MRRLTLIPVLAALITGCTAEQLASTSSGYKSVEKTVATVLISDAQEDELGKQIHNELDTPKDGKPALKYVTDAQVNGYVEGLIAKLIPHADKDRPQKWHVYVIDDPKTVNAFATPGAQIYVYTGLLMTATTEAEVIGVLGHELGHVVARHSARQLVNAYGINAITTVALGKDPGTAAQIAAAIVGNGTMLAHSRSDENEADTYAVKYSAAANYDAAGIAGFFEKLIATGGNTPTILTWVSTHPAPADRIATVNKLVMDQGLAGRGEVGAEKLAPIKQRIAAIPR